MIDEDRVKKILDFFTILKHTKSPWYGKPFILHDWQKKILTELYGTVNKEGLRQYRQAFLFLARKNGKGLALDTPMPTPDGWTTMGQVKVGDKLYDEQGKECTVTFVSDDRFLDCYKITFSNGEEIIADADHLWLTTARVNKPGCRTKEKIGGKLERARTTKELHNTVFYGKRNDRNHSIMMPKPIDGEEKELLIPPYVLGAWLGDGHTQGARMTIGSEDEAEMLEILNKEDITAKAVHRKSGTWIALHRKDDGTCRRGHKGYFKEGIDQRGNHYLKCMKCENLVRYARKHGLPMPKYTKFSLQEKLRDLNLLHNKHIPKEYLRASISQRIALLQGLMDTDGYSNPDGKILEFTSIFEQLANDFCELLSTLGIKYSIKPKKMRCNGRNVPGTCFKIQFCIAKEDVPCFRLKRKLKRQRSKEDNKVSARSRTVQITNVEPVESVITRCIQVNSPNRLFLCGKTMIPTHNSELAAALALYHLFADNCPGGEIYSAAADREQASLIFNVARDMVRQVPELRKRSKVIETQKRIVNYRNNSFYRAIPAEAASAHGYNASAVIIDELHTQPNRELYDVLTTSTGTRDEPMIISISTAGFDKNHSICGEVYNYAKKVKEGIVDDPTFYPVIYEADELDDWTDEKTWYKANPALGQFRKIEELQAMCKKAQAVPSLENTFKRLYLNIWTAQETRWLQMSKWDASAGEINLEELRGRVCYGGLDLASTTDIAAFSLVFPMDDGSFKILPFFWIPEENMRDRVNRDKVPYDVWVRDGYIEATAGNVIHYAAIEQKIQELAEEYDIRQIAFDRWGAIQLTQDLEDVGFQVLGFGQGFASMNAPTKELLNLILSKKLHHGGNPVLRWMADNVVVKEDPAGNIKPDKSKSAEKIDGIVATIMALDLAIRNQEGPSVYETRGILSF